MTDRHVSPIEDLVAHDVDTDDCVCGPRSVPVKRDDGSIGWVLVHHELRPNIK